MTKRVVQKQKRLAPEPRYKFFSMCTSGLIFLCSGKRFFSNFHISSNWSDKSARRQFKWSVWQYKSRSFDVENGASKRKQNVFKMKMAEWKRTEGTRLSWNSSTNDRLRRNLHLFVREQNTSWVMKLPYTKAWSKYVITFKKNNNLALKHMCLNGIFST